MITSYSNPSRLSRGWLSVPLLLVGLLTLAPSARAQEGSQGNTTIFGGAQMTFFGTHNFLTGGGGTQPGIIGTVRTAPFGVLNFASTATSHSGANDANHVDGYVRKLGTGSFIFPTGDNGHYGPFAAAADGTTGAYFFVDPTSAVTSNLAGGNYPVLPTGGPFPSATKEAALSAVSTKEYWDIDGANATKITLTWSSPSAVGTLTGSNLSHLTIAGWNGTQWVRIPSSFDATSVLGGSSSLTTGSITSTAAITPDTYTAYTLASYVVTSTPNPDNNVTYVNVPVPGNVSTNDQVPAGTTYGTPTASAGNPSGGTITLQPDGTYSFTGTTPGSYTYTVPVCPPGQTTGCPTTPLVIKVLPLNPTSIDPPMPPVANIDVTSVKGDPTNPSSVTVDVRANDQPATTGGTLDPPTIVTPPTHGTATVGPDGNIIYKPAPGYYGDDLLTYQVCEPATGQCTTAQEVIHVLPPDATNSTIAADDYVTTPYGVPATGNVKTNDTDPEGNTQTVVAQTVTTAQGTLVLGSDGNYTFYPAPGFTGPANFTYTTCDNGTPQACANATLYVLVGPALPDLTPTIFTRPSTVHGTTNVSYVIRVTELNGVATSGLITVRISKDPRVNLTLPAGATSVGGQAVQNSAWTFSGPSGGFYTLTTNQVIPANGELWFGLTGTVTPGATDGTLSSSVVIIPGSGGEVVIDNNIDADSIDYFQQ